MRFRLSKFLACTIATLLLPGPFSMNAAADPKAVGSTLPPAFQGIDSIENRTTNTKISSIILPEVRFNKLDITAVVDFLTLKSKELDPQHVGLSFRLDWPPEPVPKSLNLIREVTVTLDKAPIDEVVAFVCVQTGLTYKYVKGTIVLFPGPLLPPGSIHRSDK